MKVLLLIYYDIGLMLCQYSRYKSGGSDASQNLNKKTKPADRRILRGWREIECLGGDSIVLRIRICRGVGPVAVRITPSRRNVGDEELPASFVPELGSKEYDVVLKF